MPSSLDALGGDLPTATAFLFEVDGVSIGMFREVRGLSVEVAVEIVPEGGQNAFARKLPGRMSWPNIIFRRGLTNSDALFDWLNESSGETFATKGNKLVRRTGAIVAMSYTGARLRAWDIIDAFPVRWIGPDFATGKNEPLEEQLEIAHHGFRARTISSVQ